MNIAFIVPKLIKTGPILVVEELCYELVSTGHNVKVFFFSNADEPYGFYNIPSKKIEIKDIKKFSKFDIVHSHCFIPDLFVSIFRSFIGKEKIISTLHNYVADDPYLDYVPIKAMIISKIWIFNLRRINNLVALSEGAVSYYSKILPNANLSFCYNGLNFNKISNLSFIDNDNDNDIALLKKLKNDSTILGTCCNLTYRKGVDLSIKALSILPSSFVLVIIGDGVERVRLEALVTTLKLDDRVFFLGQKRNPFPYFTFFDNYLMPSRSEGFGLAVVEACSLVNKVVISDITTFRELFSSYNGKGFYFFESDCSVSLSESILASSKDDAIPKINDDMLNFVRINFSSNNLARNYLSTYERLLNIV
ncbi:MAG: glycosyltransferase involved in cell wall biosynthesis [Colwellia sp.]|jgi:glycosyltransferase involved in cell wall biosynthesis